MLGLLLLASPPRSSGLGDPKVDKIISKVPPHVRNGRGLAAVFECCTMFNDQRPTTGQQVNVPSSNSPRGSGLCWVEQMSGCPSEQVGSADTGLQCQLLVLEMRMFHTRYIEVDIRGIPSTTTTVLVVESGI